MTKQTYIVGKMDCAGCAREVEDGVSRLAGVDTVQVDFLSGKMFMTGSASYDQLKVRVEGLGKTLEHPPTRSERPTPKKESFWSYILSRPETSQSLVGGSIALLGLLLSLTGLQPAEGIVVQIFYVIGMLIALDPILKNGLSAFLVTRQFNINLLMSLATIGTLFIGEYLEGATVIVFFAVGEALEGFTAGRARGAIESLMTLQPKTALLLNDCGDASCCGDQTTEVEIETLQVGDKILIKPGTQIPLDSRVLAGHSGVNQAPITGESVPVEKGAGAELFAGTLNGEGTLTAEVIRLAADSTLERIIQMVEEAQAAKAPTTRIVDRFAAWYTPAVVLLAALVAFIVPLLIGQPIFGSGLVEGERSWFYRGLAILVIACPCALVISTPVTIISGIAAAARRGILIKGGLFLEKLGQIQAVAFDKTGTLTLGKPAVMQHKSLACTDDDDCTACDDLLALAGAVEMRTAHPLADAVVAAVADRNLQARYRPAEAVQTLVGRGVTGQVGNQAVTLGSHRYFDETFPHSETLCADVRHIEASGQTAMLVATDNEVQGYISLADEPRASSQSVIETLNRSGLKTVMLTGDNRGVAQAVAAEIGVSDVRAELLPADKVAAVEALKSEYGQIAMIGDGINDTPALAAADLGIAMGGAGSPQALETADIALMQDDLTQLPFAFDLARFVRQLIQQNIWLSFGVKALFLVLAFFGLTSLWVAILADVGMALLVTLNGMRPLSAFSSPQRLVPIRP